jgi:phenylacetate-CoA ligase
MSLYSSFVRNIYYPIACFLKGERALDYLRNFEENQWKPQEEILEFQKIKLFEILNYVYENIPFYRQKYQAAKIDPKDIRTLKDFSEIPKLTKEEVRAYSLSIQNRSFKGKIHNGYTSGSTGMPLSFYYDSNFIASTWANRWRGRGFWDVKIGDKELALWGRPINSNFVLWKQRIMSRIKNVLFFSAFSLSEEKLEHYWDRMVRFRPDYIYGYPSAIYQLCQYGYKKGFSLLGIKAIFCTAETLYWHQKRLIEQILNSPTVNEYGCSETGAFAYECSEGNLHISAENVYCEFELNNKQVLPGELGEIVVTNLNNFFMPLIRYRVGDMGIYRIKPCPCGRALPSMKISVGKSSETISTLSGRKVHTEIFDYINRYLLENKAYGIVYFRVIRKTMNGYLVQIVKGDDFNTSVLEKFSKKMREFLGGEIEINYEFLECIPRDKTGKIRYYISEISELEPSQDVFLATERSL